ASGRGVKAGVPRVGGQLCEASRKWEGGYARRPASGRGVKRRIGYFSLEFALSSQIPFYRDKAMPPARFFPHVPVSSRPQAACPRPPATRKNRSKANALVRCP